MKENQLHMIREWLQIPFRHKKKASVLFLSVLVVTFAALLLLPRTYRSEAVLFVRLGRESVSLDPTATTGQTVGLTDSREVEINSILEILRSRGLAAKVVDSVGPQRILDMSPDLNSSGRVVEGGIGWAYGLLGQYDPVNDYERAVTKLQNDLTITSQRRTTVIDLSCDSQSPQLAQSILTTLLDFYAKEHARLNHTAGSFDFFNEQVALLEKKLDAANEALRSVKNKSGLLSLEGQRTMLQQEMNNVEGELLSAEHTLASSQAKAKSLAAAVIRMPDRLHTDELHGVANSGSDEMRKTLYDLELKQFEIRAKYTDEHPETKAITRQVADAKAVLARQDKDRTHWMETINPARVPLVTALASQESDEAAASARLATLTRQRETVLGRLTTLNDVETQITERQRHVNQLEAMYKTYVEKREQSRVDQALAQERVSNVNVAQAPTLMLRPVRPNRLLVLALGLLVAIGGTLALVIVAEYLDQTLQTPREVEQVLETSVLLTIPRMSHHRVLLN